MYHYPLFSYFLLQTSIFVYNFYSGVNFCEKKIGVILFCENLFWRIAKKPAKIAKIAKIRTCKNLVPHGSSQQVFLWLSVDIRLCSTPIGEFLLSNPMVFTVYFCAFRAVFC